MDILPTATPRSATSACCHFAFGRHLEFDLNGIRGSTMSNMRAVTSIYKVCAAPRLANLHNHDVLRRYCKDIDCKGYSPAQSQVLARVTPLPSLHARRSKQSSSLPQRVVSLSQAGLSHSKGDSFGEPSEALKKCGLRDLFFFCFSEDKKRQKFGKKIFLSTSHFSSHSEFTGRLLNMNQMNIFILMRLN